MKISLNLVGVIACALVAILQIVLGHYINSLGWIVATIWAYTAYLWYEIAGSQNELLDELKTALQKIAEEVKR